MRRDSKYGFSIHAALFVLALAGIAPVAYTQVAVKDVVTVGTVASPTRTIDVPVSIRDVSGSPLGRDQPAGSRIQSYTIKVTYAPAAVVQSVTFTRAGITQPLTPTFESSPASAGAISLIDTFTEATNLIPFTLDGAAPGNQVGHLVFTLLPSAPSGTQVTLTLDPTLTILTDEGGDAATKESVGGGNLALVNGIATYTDAVPTLSTSMLMLLAVVLAVAGVRFRS